MTKNRKLGRTLFHDHATFEILCRILRKQGIKTIPFNQIFYEEHQKVVKSYFHFKLQLTLSKSLAFLSFYLQLWFYRLCHGGREYMYIYQTILQIFCETTKSTTEDTKITFPFKEGNQILKKVLKSTKRQIVFNSTCRITIWNEKITIGKTLMWKIICRLFWLMNFNFWVNYALELNSIRQYDFMSLCIEQTYGFSFVHCTILRGISQNNLPWAQWLVEVYIILISFFQNLLFLLTERLLPLFNERVTFILLSVDIPQLLITISDTRFATMLMAVI